MQQQQPNPSRTCRVRSMRPFGYALLAVPAVAAIGALSLPALAAAGQPHLSNASQPVAAAPTRTTASTPVPKNHPVTAHTSHRTTTTTSRPTHGKPPAPTATKQRQAFFKAGYDYDDAVLLSRLWANGVTPDDAKLRAGDKLLHHVALPTKPGDTADTVSQDVALMAYVDNGYGYDDALRLAQLWQAPTAGNGIADVKTTAGRKLLAGLSLPVEPGGAPASSADAELAAFSGAGYGYDDAVLLSRLWAQGITPYDAKLQAGDKLLHHLAPPTRPGDTADTVSRDVALLAYADNGYGYDDAGRLAKLWHVKVSNGNLDDVKVTAGRKLLAGLRLPVGH